MADNKTLEGIEVGDDVWKLGHSSLLQPRDDLLARPMVIVVQVQDDRVQRKPLLAADRALPADVLEAIEQATHSRADRMRFFRIARQRVRAFVRRAERAGSTRLREVFAEGLSRTPLRACGDGIGELDLI